MYDEAQSRTAKSLADQHIDDLMEVLEELLATPELLCFVPGEISDATRDLITKARVVRRAVLDEFTAVGTAP